MALDQTVLSLFQKWQITSFILGSLVTQVLMVVSGATRTRSCRPVRFVAWAAFNMRDYMASTALGALAQAASTQSEAVYAVWAPILLLHLGGPDNFCVWQIDDSEDWRRQCLTFGLQLMTASYVMAKCGVHQAWGFTLLSFCLFAGGALKYAERIVAMKQATLDSITESALPIYFFMVGEPGISREERQQQPDAASADHYHRYYYIICGEKEWYKHYEHAGAGITYAAFNAAAQKAGHKLITVHDVLHTRALRAHSQLCISYALHKMYERRLSHLFMYEWRREDVKELLLGTAPNTPLRSTEDVVRVLDAELGFLYDRLYTKAAGTAYSVPGILLRMASVVLLAAVWAYIFRSSNSDLVKQGSVSQAKRVTLALVSISLVLEVYHLLRVLASDWARVWLASTYCQIEVQAAAPGERPLSWSQFLGMHTFALPLVVLKKLMPSSVGPLYWRDRVGQYSIASVHPMHWDLSPDRRTSLSRFMHFIGAHNHESSLEGSIAKQFKLEVVQRVIERCRELQRNHRTDVSQPFWFLFERMGGDQEELAVVWALMGGNIGDRNVGMDLEHLVMNCHVATFFCESPWMVDSATSNTSIANNQGQDQVSGLGLGLQLSKYATYLLVHKTELLPCHAAITRKLANDTQRALGNVLASLPAMTWIALQSMINEGEQQGREHLRNGVRAAELLQAIHSDMQRWKLICNVWLDILIHMAYANNASAHLHELTKGGELLNHLWVLLGHLGYGQQ